MSEKVLDISEVKPGDEFVYHGANKSIRPHIYRVITIGEETVFMGVEEGPYYRETLIRHSEIEDGSFVRYKKPKVEVVRRSLAKDKDYGICWHVDYPDRPMIGSIQVTVVDDKITKVEIVDV